MPEDGVDIDILIELNTRIDIDKSIRIPESKENILKSNYGVNWKHELEEWRWDIDPFLTGYCRY